MHRANQWPARLALFILEKSEQPFDWKVNNCCFFACDWLAIMVAVDPAEKYRALSAEALQKVNVVSVITRIAAMNDWPRVSVAYARRGDIVLKNMVGPTLGVCNGQRSVFPGKDGIVTHPTHTCEHAWRIA